MDQTIETFKSGTHNVEPDETIPRDAASSSLNWITRDGRIELVGGRRTIGADGAAGANYGEWFGYTAAGVAVHFRKVEGAVQYLNGTTWTDVITGLTSTDVTFTNYQSLAGAFTYIFSPDDGIYKICTANPDSYTSLYNEAKNFKGYGFIDKGRTILWGRKTDPTGLYGSYIDGQDSAVYTSVSSEATTSLTGTLAFKSGGATRTCFGVEITLTSSGEVYSDDFNGNLTGDAGGTGTINYTTGEYTLSASGVGTANYQWEDSNSKGVTDFTKSSPRQAGEGFVLRQDKGGDAIRTVIPHDGSYFSLKANSCYQLTLDAADTDPVNELIRSDIGVNNLRAAVGTGQGIVFMNTANPTEPKLNIIKRNLNGDNFDTIPLFDHFKWSDFGYDTVVLDTWDKYVLVSCTYDAGSNNRLLLANIIDNTVDTTYYGASSFAKNGGYLFAGDPVSQSTHELFTGVDDNEIQINNYWDSNGEKYRTDRLKRTKKFRFKGRISPQQSVKVFISRDESDWQHVGTILGSGDYVDYSSSYAIGTTVVGSSTIGGDDTPAVYRFFMELKVRTEKFRKRKLRLQATGFGYVAFDQITDFDIWMYQDKMPSRYRLKQNVSLDGQTTDQDTPEY